MIRAVMLEHPELRCKLIDIEAATSADRIGPLLAECVAEDAENQVAIRGKIATFRGWSRCRKTMYRPYRKRIPPTSSTSRNAGFLKTFTGAKWPGVRRKGSGQDQRDGGRPQFP